MSRWFRVYDDLLDDRTAQTMPPDQFRDAVYEAVKHGTGPLSEFIMPDKSNGRLEATAWNALRSAVFQEDNYTCAYCGSRGGKLECDHIVPLSRGGTNDRSNLTTACFNCNRSKRNKLVAEWRQ